MGGEVKFLTEIITYVSLLPRSWKADRKDDSFAERDRPVVTGDGTLAIPLLEIQSQSGVGQTGSEAKSAQVDDVQRSLTHPSRESRADIP